MRPQRVSNPDPPILIKPTKGKEKQLLWWGCGSDDRPQIAYVVSDRAPCCAAHHHTPSHHPILNAPHATKSLLLRLLWHLYHLTNAGNPVASPARRPGHPGTDIRPTSLRDNLQLNRQTPVPGKPGGQARKTGVAMVVVAVRH